jgi:tRNA (guanine-N7-)-methyltransferase
MGQSGVSSPNRVPVEHPDYRYPSARNPYATKVREFDTRIFSDNGTEEHRDAWRTLLPDAGGSSAVTSSPGASSASGSVTRVLTDRPLHVEIGCNAGHVIVEWAARDPESAYIGIDWKWKPIYRAAEKGWKRKINNLLFFRAHAIRLQQMFAPGEIDRLYLFFPDPWPKKKQWKNRFITAERLREIAPLLKKGGVFHIKTDHRKYFDWMEEHIAQVRDLWDVTERTTDLHAGNPNAVLLKEPEVTLFERLFIKDGLPINQVKLIRR